MVLDGEFALLRRMVGIACIDPSIESLVIVVSLVHSDARGRHHTRLQREKVQLELFRIRDLDRKSGCHCSVCTQDLFLPNDQWWLHQRTVLVHVVVVHNPVCNFDLQLVQGVGRLFLGVIGSPLLGVGERRARLLAKHHVDIAH